jgi:asparagine synthase (glutamine-hydrolysing)
MCGIAGILGRVDDRNRAALKRMSEAMVHRGPDDAGTWESAPSAEGRGALLAFRRLSILDLSPAGHQPMVDPGTGQVLVFNGEVYNFRELRERLVSRGHRFESSGDAAVALRTLATEGPDAVASFQGMFAFACWDPARRTLLLARDPLGIKPLYLARSTDRTSGWNLAFASEVRALLASGLVGSPRLDPTAAASVVWNGYIMGPGSAVQGIELLPPGQFQLHGDDGSEGRKREYWRLPDRDSVPRTDEQQLAALLEKTVGMHLVSDVPLGVFLSGGIDSSAVANLAQKANRGPVHTFTLAFEEEEFNEGHHARRIAEAIGTEHREVLLTEQHFVEHLDHAIDSLDQPTFDGLNSYMMSRAVRDAGFTVALVGTGGDELFGGYPTFRDLPALHTWSRRLGFVPRAALVEGAQLAVAALQPERGGMARQSRWAKLPEMIRRGDDLLALYQLAYALFLPDFQRELLTRPEPEGIVDGLPRVLHAELQRMVAGRSELQTISVLEQRLFLGERLLRDNDVASMAASIEQRLPLVDSVLLEAVMGLPDPVRYQPVTRKALLRRVGLRGLDPALFERPKRGFVLPFERWIRQRLSSHIDRTLRDPDAVRSAGLRPEAVDRLWRGFLDGAPGLYWSRVWAVYILVHWCSRHGLRAS